MASLTLIIPAYNEEYRLPPFLQSIADYSSDSHHPAIEEIIVVDDGSTDATVAAAQKFLSLLPQLKIISFPDNRGKGAAVQAGILAARGEYIIFIDADGATSISELPKMVAALASSEIAVGNRWQPASQTVRSSPFRHLAGFTNRWYMKLAGLGEIDTMCGFKGYRRHIALDLFSDLKEKRWLFDTEVAYKSILRGYQTRNFPITWESKEGSKLKAATLLKTAWEIYPLLHHLRRDEKKRALKVPSGTTS